MTLISASKVASSSRSASSSTRKRVFSNPFSSPVCCVSSACVTTHYLRTTPRLCVSMISERPKKQTVVIASRSLLPILRFISMSSNTRGSSSQTSCFSFCPCTRMLPSSCSSFEEAASSSCASYAICIWGCRGCVTDP